MNSIKIYIAQFLWIVLLSTNLLGYWTAPPEGQAAQDGNLPVAERRESDGEKGPGNGIRAGGKPESKSRGRNSDGTYIRISGTNTGDKRMLVAMQKEQREMEKHPPVSSVTNKEDGGEGEILLAKGEPADSKSPGESGGQAETKAEQELAARGEKKAGSRASENPPQTSEPPAAPQGFNQIVLEMIKTYRGGGYPYLLNNDYANYNGVTENLYYEGNLFLKAHPSGNRASHCVGITFEVFFKSMQEWNRRQGRNTGRIGNLSYAQMQDFMLQWYAADGAKDQSNLTTALERYGLGKRITDLNAAQPGDFMDLSRENNTGHAVVFLGWIWEGGRIVGIHYWSSQNSTGGISEKTEYFNVYRNDGTKYGNVRMDNLYIGRVTP